MKVLCAVNLHNWEIMEQIKMNAQKITVIQYKVCKKCGDSNPVGAYETFFRSKLNSIINQINLN